MNTRRLLINPISELIHNNANDWFGDNLSRFSIAPLSQITKEDTHSPKGLQCLFCFSRSTTNQKQKWGFYVRIYRWRSILWRL